MRSRGVWTSCLLLWATLLASEGIWRSYGQISVPPAEEAAGSQAASEGGSSSTPSTPFPYQAAVVDPADLNTAPSGSDGLPQVGATVQASQSPSPAPDSSGDAGLVNNSAMPGGASASAPTAPTDGAPSAVSDPGAASGFGDASGSGAASGPAQDGSTAPTVSNACCPPPPGQQPAAAAQTSPAQKSDGPRYGPDGNIIPEYTEGQGPEDEARSHELKHSLFGKGRHPSANGSQSQTQIFPPPASLPEQLDPVNQLVVAQLQRELQNGALTQELCLDSAFRLYASAGAAIDPRIQALNTKGANHDELVEKLKKQHKSPWPLQLTPEEEDVANDITQGRLDGVDPNLRWSFFPQQSGDICIFPGYWKDTKQANGRVDSKLVPGHVGIVLFNAKKNEWEFVSTNNGDSNNKVQPGWTVVPLEDIGKDWFAKSYDINRPHSSGEMPQFFHWIGPEPSTSGP